MATEVRENDILIPGLSRKCKSCRFKRDSEYPNHAYLCKLATQNCAAEIVVPELYFDKEGRVVCDPYEPNLATLLREEKALFSMVLIAVPRGFPL